MATANICAEQYIYYYLSVQGILSASAQLLVHEVIDFTIYLLINFQQHNCETRALSLVLQSMCIQFATRTYLRLR